MARLLPFSLNLLLPLALPLPSLAGDAPSPFDVRPACALAEARLRFAEEEPGRRLEHLAVARAALLEACERGPLEGLPHLLLARVRLGENRPEEAAGEAALAEQLLPRDPRPPTVRGEALLRAGDPDAALGALDAAAGLDPGGPEAARLLLLRARARLRTGDVPGAAADAGQALERAPSSGDAQALLRWCARREAAGALEGSALDAGAGFAVRSEVGPEAAAAAAARLARLEREAGSTLGPIPAPSRRTRVHLLAAARYGALAPEGGSGARGFYQRDEQAVFVLAERPREAERLLAHEAVHALLHRLVEDAPAWLDEGLADALAEDPHQIRLHDARALLGAGGGVALGDLALRSRREMYAPEGIQLRFAAAWGIARYLRVEEPARLARILAALRTGASPSEVVRAGFSDLERLSDFDRRWRDHVLALPP